MDPEDLADHAFVFLKKIGAGATLDQEEIEGISAFLLLRSMQSGPSNGFESDFDNSGYFIKKTKKYDLRIPFNLIAGFPSGDLLEAIIDVAEKGRVQIDSCICIGGSTTFLGQIPIIGDLDYCEYVDAQDQYDVDIANSIANMLSDDDVVVLCKAKCGQAIASFPWPEEWSGWLGANLNGAPEPRIAHRLKLDFCVFSDQLGVLPGSNIVLPMAPGETDHGNAADSFPYQEAIIDFGKRQPRGLLNPEQFAVYLTFLYDQALEKIENDPIKSLKRLLSLYRALGLPLFDDVALEVLSGEGASALVRWKRRAELRELSSGVDPTTRARIELALGEEAARAHIPPEASARHAEEGARKIARAMLGYLHARMAPTPSEDGGPNDQK